MINTFAIFHLNLAYSSIPHDAHGEVIQRCYTPLLDIIERDQYPFGIELSGWTLQRIATIAPDWLARFKQLLHEQRCELIGSGYTQLIGPLAPYDVNVWNQRLGLEAYDHYLDTRPGLVLVNEMAYSSSLVSIYDRAGYQAMVMDRDNICLALGLDAHQVAKLPCYADGGNGAALPVLWSDSILFQKLQRYVHGDIRLTDYLDYFRQRAAKTCASLAVYGNDAEIFDYRPGRYREEARLHEQGEWRRLRQLLAAIDGEGAGWLTPTQALLAQCAAQDAKPVKLTSAAQPIPVKKQAKYNISRWAATGRDDLWLNTMCHRLHQALLDSPHKDDPGFWRRLTELWASDLRTHIHHDRWETVQDLMAKMAEELSVDMRYGAVSSLSSRVGDSAQRVHSGVIVKSDPEGILLSVNTESIQLTLNLRRGLTIHALAFRRHGFKPVVGTIPHGYFHSIELGADFYSGNTVVEMLTEQRRITDLDWVTPYYSMDNGVLTIDVTIDTHYGKIAKRVKVPIGDERIEIDMGFPGWQRPYGTARIGALTLLPEAFNNPLKLAVASGGQALETFQLTENCQHGQPASSLVSCSTGLGGSAGRLRLGDGETDLDVTWDPGQCAAFPMLTHYQCSPASLTRIHFSLGEVDDTYRPGGALPSFAYTISPRCGD